MAKLTLDQKALDLEREKRRQEAVKEKMEIQKKKELYGENWKEVLHNKMNHEISIEIGADKAPKLYDSKDVYDFLDPISFYEDREYKPLKMDLKAFQESEVLYKEAIEALDKELAELSKTSDEEKGSILNEDGNIPEEDILPVKTDGVNATEEIKKTTPTARHKARLNSMASIYFERFLPLYNKYQCSCCGRSLKLENFYTIYSISHNARIDDRGNRKLDVCKECTQKLLAYYYEVESNKNIELAMQYVCASLNLYWDVDLFYIAKQKFYDGDRRGTLIGTYIASVNSEHPGDTFMNSPFLTDEQYNSQVRVITGKKEDAPYDWSVEDARNKKTVLKMVGYDPFEYEPEEDKKILYRDLLNILDEGMENDFVKFQAGIQIVQSFYKIRKMNEKQSKLEREDAALSELKALSDLKAKELKSITDFSRDNGFAERYANAKAKGENTFTGIMNKMSESKFENAIANRYNIETSATIQQAADASFKAIFNQLNFGESEVWKITQDQFAELTKLRKELSKAQEDLRKTKYELAEVRLKEKERENNKKRGISEEDE